MAKRSASYTTFEIFEKRANVVSKKKKTTKGNFLKSAKLLRDYPLEKKNPRF